MVTTTAARKTSLHVDGSEKKDERGSSLYERKPGQRRQWTGCGGEDVDRVSELLRWDWECERMWSDFFLDSALAAGQEISSQD